MHARILTLLICAQPNVKTLGYYTLKRRQERERERESAGEREGEIAFVNKMCQVFLPATAPPLATTSVGCSLTQGSLKQLPRSVGRDRFDVQQIHARGFRATREFGRTLRAHSSLAAPSGPNLSVDMEV